MIESFLDLKDTVQEALKQTGHMELQLDIDEWDLLEELKQFLNVFKELTELVSSGNAGLSLIPLINNEIRGAVQPMNLDSPSLSNLKHHIEKNIDRRFPVTETVELGVLLDPSTKDTMNKGKDQANEILRDAVAQVDSSGSQSVSPADATAATDHQMQSSKKQRLIEKLKSDDSSDAVNDEISRYLASKPTPAQVDNPILFWKTNHQNFPLLSKLARKYLCVSASSVPVECMFSITGLILNGKRSQLAPYKQNYLTFVHDNYPVFFKV